MNNIEYNIHALFPFSKIQRIYEYTICDAVGKTCKFLYTVRESRILHTYFVFDTRTPRAWTDSGIISARRETHSPLSVPRQVAFPSQMLQHFIETKAVGEAILNKKKMRRILTEICVMKHNLL